MTTNSIDTMRESGWRPAAETPDAVPSKWDGSEVGNDVRLELWLGARSAVGAQYFRCYLLSALGRTVEPVVFGLQSSGRWPGAHWVQVIQYREQVRLEDGQAVEVPYGMEQGIFARFASEVPAGGSLLAEYESDARSVTAQALASKVPPLATPLGALLYSVGCGDAFRDCYTPEGGREGPRMLQGFRAIDDAQRKQRGLEMLAELSAFMARSADLDWGLQAQTRPIAQAAIEALTARFE